MKTYNQYIPHHINNQYYPQYSHEQQINSQTANRPIYYVTRLLNAQNQTSYTIHNYKDRVPSPTLYTSPILPRQTMLLRDASHLKKPQNLTFHNTKPTVIKPNNNILSKNRGGMLQNTQPHNTPKPVTKNPLPFNYNQKPSYNIMNIINRRLESDPVENERLVKEWEEWTRKEYQLSDLSSPIKTNLFKKPSPLKQKLRLNNSPKIPNTTHVKTADNPHQLSLKALGNEMLATEWAELAVVIYGLPPISSPLTESSNTITSASDIFDSCIDEQSFFKQKLRLTNSPKIPNTTHVKTHEAKIKPKAYEPSTTNKQSNMAVVATASIGIIDTVWAFIKNIFSSNKSKKNV